MNLKKIAIEIHQVNIDNGFSEVGKRRNVGEVLMLVTSELAEALEADRKDLMDDKLTHRTGFEVELADAMIRILDIAEEWELDLEGAIREKLDYNKTRGYKHGNKKY